MHQVHLRVDPSTIPDHIDVDVTPLTIGHSYHVRDLELPEGVTILDDAGATVCVCTAPKTVEETPAAAGRRRRSGSARRARAHSQGEGGGRGRGQVIGVVLRFLFGRGDNAEAPARRATTSR